MKRALTEATNMKRTLTETQSKILEFIVRYQREHNITPSYREIANGCGLASSSTVHRNLATLKDLGIIKGGTNGKKDHRNIVVMLDNGEGNTTNAFAVPVLGRVAAGVPILAQESVEGSRLYNTHGRNSFYALQIKGNSMVDLGILDGDFVIVERNVIPREKQIVIALIDDEATCKEFHRDENGHIWLIPHNVNDPKYKPIYGDDCIIQGVVRGLQRDFPI